MQGLTLEQLQNMGAKPVQTGGLTLEQLQGQSSQAPISPPQSPSIWDKFLSAGTAVTNFLGGKSTQETFGAELAKIGKTPEQKANISAGQPTVGQTVGSGIQLGALFAPVGGIAGGITTGARALGLKTGVSALGKIGAGALIGEAFDVGTNLQEGKTGISALRPGFGTAIGAGIPALGVAKNVLVRFGHEQAPRIINSLIKPLAKDFSYGKNPGRAVAESGIVANTFDDLANQIRDVRQTTGQEIGALGRKLSTKPIIDISDSLSPLNDAIETAAEQNNPTLLQRLANVKKAITHVLAPALNEAGDISIQEVGARKLNGLTFSEARDVLGRIGDITQFTGNPSDDKAVNSALKKIYGLVKEESLNAAEQINPELASTFKTATEKYADLISAEIATKYRDKIVERSNLVGLSPQVVGIGSGIITLIATGGAATPAVIAGATGAVLDKLASTPGFKTRLAALLSKKSPQEVNLIFQKFPALKGFLARPTKVFPGDILMEGETGQAIKQGVKDFIENPKIGLGIEDISKKAGGAIPPTTTSLNDLGKSSAIKSDLAQEARKYKSAEEFVKARDSFRVESAAENIDKMKQNGFDHVINEDGTFTLYHKTTLTGANGIERTGFRENSFFADSAESADALASTNKRGNSKVLEIKVDPADIFYNSGTNEFEASAPLIKGRDGVYREKGLQSSSQLTDLWNKAKGTEALGDDIVNALRQTKGLSAEDIMAKHPDINLKRDVAITDIHGNKAIIPEGEALTPYELKGNKVLLQDGETYIVSKNQYQNIKGQSVSGEAKEFAPELRGTEETINAEKSSKDIMTPFFRKMKTKYGENVLITDYSPTDYAEYVRLSNQDVSKNIIKFSQYQLPGGKNYRETIHKDPKFPVKPDESHFGDAASWNRTTDQIHNGKKYLFIEEIQKGKHLDETVGHPWAKGKYIERELKSIFKRAVDEGYDGVAWTTGEQQAARYNLSTQLDYIKWDKPTDLLQKSSDVKSVSLRATGRARGEDMKITVDSNGKVVETLRSAPSEWKGKQLGDVIGKGVAEKILAEPKGNLSGEGLNIGGEWAKNLYDKQVKNIVEDVTGHKVEVIDMGLPIDNKTAREWAYVTPRGGTDALTPKNLKVEMTVNEADSTGNFADSIDYIITDILGDGKFKAVPKAKWEMVMKDKAKIPDTYKQSFDISTKKSAGQQAILLTPEIKALVKGQSLIKQPSGKVPFK